MLGGSSVDFGTSVGYLIAAREALVGSRGQDHMTRADSNRGLGRGRPTRDRKPTHSYSADRLVRHDRMTDVSLHNAALSSPVGPTGSDSHGMWNVMSDAKCNTSC